MAKKQKVELTPEEKAAKKLRHSNGCGSVFDSELDWLDELWLDELWLDELDDELLLE